MKQVSVKNEIDKIFESDNHSLSIRLGIEEKNRITQARKDEGNIHTFEPKPFLRLDMPQAKPKNYLKMRIGPRNEIEKNK